MNPPSARKAPVRLVYLVVGIVIGGVWALNSGTPLWEHAAKTLALVLTVPFLIHWLRARRERRAGITGRPQLALRRLVAAKLSLVAVALGVNAALDGHVPDADYIVAAGLTAAIALLGPLLHPHLLKPIPTSPNTQAPRVPAKPSRRRRGTVIAIAAALVVTASALGELIVRQTLESRIGTALASSVNATVHIGIGATPALLDLAKGSVSTVSVTIDGFRTCKLGAVTLDGSFHDATRNGGQVHTTASQASMTIPPTTLTSLLAQHNPQLARASVQPDPATGSLQIALGTGGLLTITEQPALSGEILRFTPGPLLLGGAPAPAAFAQNLAAKAALTIPLPHLPMNLTPRSVQVTSDGIVVTASGGPATFGPGSHEAAAHSCP